MMALQRSMMLLHRSKLCNRMNNLGLSTSIVAGMLSGVSPLSNSFVISGESFIRQPEQPQSIKWGDNVFKALKGVKPVVRRSRPLALHGRRSLLVPPHLLDEFHDEFRVGSRPCGRK